MSGAEGGVIDGCCIAVYGAFQQYFNTTQWGMDWKCCDTCCQCKCCWDEGEFDPNDRPDFSQQQQDSGPKAQADIGRQGEPSDEDLPAYKPSEGMKVPSTAQYQPATGAIATQSQGS